MRDLDWLGVHWDEGVSCSGTGEIGEYGPYKQTSRLRIYKDYAEILVKEGKAYYAENEINDEVNDLGSIHRGKAIKIKVPENKEYEFDDLVRGKIKINSSTLNDFVIIRANGIPVYNFANPIDDYLMKMTHVFRAEEHLYNTIKQLIVYEAFNFKAPVFGHLSIILGQDKQKLSKRHGAVSCDEYRKKGILPEALMNCLALLGWNPKDNTEFLEKNELINRFEISGFNSASAVFDEKKLFWLNSLHIRALNEDELLEKLRIFDNTILKNQSEVFIKKVLNLIKPLTNTLQEIADIIKLFDDQTFEIKTEEIKKLNKEKVLEVLLLWNDAISNFKNDNEITEEFLTEIIQSITIKTKLKSKEVYQPLRLAVLGKTSGLDFIKIVPLMDLKSLKHRSKVVLDYIGTIS